MNLITGEIVEIFVEDGMKMAKARVGGAFMRVSLQVLPEAQVADQILIESGVAISKMEPQKPEEKEHVLGSSRKSVRD